MNQNLQQPSGLERGIPFLIDAEWTPQQAWAVFEFLDDLRDCIWNRYAPHIQEMARNQQAPADQDQPAQQSR